MLVFFVGIVSNVLIKEYVKYRMIFTLYISTFLSLFKQKQKVDRFHAEIDESGHLHKYSRMNIVFLEI